MLLIVCLICVRCGEKKRTDSSINFTELSADITGISFNNTIIENDSVNLIANAYAYMGAGVGVGDFNNDNLPDIYFAANQSTSRLFINKGNFQFDDITAAAGVGTNSWVTGVSVVDINNDGLDDIYLSVGGNVQASARKNKLFVNKGNLKFEDEAAKYGLDDTSFSTQAVFFDYDLDGDLDMYLANHLLDHAQSNFIKPKDTSGNSPARDKLFRNNGPATKEGKPQFEEVSRECGIVEDGYSLGVVSGDFNDDGWPDIYVGNDYLANDVLWLNDGKGKFVNVIASSMGHQSYSTMGVDAADINNDGMLDLYSLDMMPGDNRRKKLMFSFMNYERYMMERDAGYQDEYMRNMLQLNIGNNRKGNNTPVFSEIAQLSGTSETDWSWSVLLADFDNDGNKDMHITNGLGRDMINNDFISFISEYSRNTRGSREEMMTNVRQKLDEYGVVELQNYLFRNNGNLQFTDVSRSAGIGPAAISSGCAYADFDNDGDVDLVVNNINKNAFVLRNELRTENKAPTEANFLRVKINGDSLNRKGLGVKVRVYSGSRVLGFDNNPVRGYLSTVDGRIMVGLGGVQIIDSILVLWPNKKQQVIRKVAVNSELSVDIRDASIQEDKGDTGSQYLFEDVSGKMPAYKHNETLFYDYGIQQLLPQKYSQLGPFIAQADVNKDGLTDLFVGGARGQQGTVMMQMKDGNFVSHSLDSGAKNQEDLGVLFFDADNDGDQDLFINSGGNEYENGSLHYMPRLYLNDGSGNFKEDKNAFPSTLFTSSQSAAAGDYDGDGFIDLFIGGRVTPGHYPLIPESYLLKNSRGKFTVVTQEVCAELQYAGMVTASLWVDIDNDKDIDLLIAGEWMPVRLFLNQDNILKEKKLVPEDVPLSGMWRSVAVADMDGDNDLDIVAGNYGLNNRFGISSETPLHLFAKDIDGNGSIDPVMAYYIDNGEGKKKLYPAITRDQFSMQVPYVRKKFPLHRDYAVADMDVVLPEEMREDMQKLVCSETRSVWLENKDGKFTVHALPVEAQFAPVNSIVCEDVDKDGKTDLLIAGNEYQAEVSGGRYDASYGLYLRNAGDGNFILQGKPTDNGLFIEGDVKDLELIRTADGSRLLIAARNNNSLKVFRLK